jgi:hypothetical protein
LAVLPIITLRTGFVPGDLPFRNKNHPASFQSRKGADHCVYFLQIQAFILTHRRVFPILPSTAGGSFAIICCITEYIQ